MLNLFVSCLFLCYWRLSTFSFIPQSFGADASVASGKMEGDFLKANLLIDSDKCWWRLGYLIALVINWATDERLSTMVLWRKKDYDVAALVLFQNHAYM